MTKWPVFAPELLYIGDKVASVVGQLLYIGLDNKVVSVVDQLLYICLDNKVAYVRQKSMLRHFGVIE